MANMKIYGVPFSQPVRAVLWLLLMKRQSFELVMVNPGSSGENGSRHPDYLKMNPAGTIPCLLEPDTGFSVPTRPSGSARLERPRGSARATRPSTHSEFALELD